MSAARYRHVLITGGAGGIGEALARRFLEDGCQVVLVDRRADALERVRRQLPRVETVALDVTDTAALQALTDRLGPRPDGPDVIVNNAGIHHAVPLTAPGYSVADQLRDIDLETRTNFTALAQHCALWLPHLTARPLGAAIVNVASALAFVPKSSSAIYCATKAAVEQFSDVLARQLAGTSVRVVTVYPPLLATGLTAGRDVRPAMTADQFARAFHRAFLRGESIIRVGETRWLYWLHRLSPGLAASRIEP
jgi:uncharacterized oxidoreductase